MLLLRSINFASWHLIAGKRNATVMIHGAICAALHLRISFDAITRPNPSLRLPAHGFHPVPSRESANHYSKRIMQTRYLIKNIFVFAWSSLLHADDISRYRAPVVTQNPQLIALIRRDCARGRMNLHARCERVFNLAYVSASRNLRNRALVNYTDARAVIRDMYPHARRE